MRFPPEFLDRLRSQVMLSEIIGRRVTLKRRGREYMACCPFHHEKTPSFTVNDDKGFYHCFGCGAHGDAIRFLTEQEGLGYVEAVERLAANVGLALPEVTPEQKAVAQRFSSLQDVMEAACKWFEQQLRDPSGDIAKEYLKSRGMVGKTAKTFRLGFSPTARDALKTHMLAQGVKETQLVELGLLIKPDSGATYDRFRGRIIFPITDRRGKVIAFGGRIIPSLTEALSKEAPKYLNSPETPLFKKGEVLYGYEIARQPAHKAGTVLVTEGYMDVTALHQSGIPYAVAPLGTAVTEGHMRLLWQLADEPVMCLDGDAAGQRAMHRAAELCLPLLKPGKSLRFLVLPKGEDPDSLVQKQGREVFEELLKSAMSLSDALWEHYAAGIAQAGPEKRAATEHTLMQLVDQIKDPTVGSHFRAYFRRLLWERAKPPERQNFQKGKKNWQDNAPAPQGRSRELEQYMRQGDQVQRARREKDMLRLILNHPTLLERSEVEEHFACAIFSDPVQDAIRQQMMTEWAENGNIGREVLEKALSGRQKVMLTSLYTALGSGDEMQAWQHWQLLAAEQQLAQMQAECRQLETEMAMEVSEEAYARLVNLKKQIEAVQQESANLQNAADTAASS